MPVCRLWSREQRDRKETDALCGESGQGIGDEKAFGPFHAGIQLSAEQGGVQRGGDGDVAGGEKILVRSQRAKLEDSLQRSVLSFGSAENGEQGDPRHDQADSNDLDRGEMAEFPAKEDSDEDGTCNNEAVGQAGSPGQTEVATHVSEAQEDKRGQQKGCNQDDGLFFFPPNRSEGIGQGAENGAEGHCDPGGKEGIFHPGGQPRWRPPRR